LVHRCAKNFEGTSGFDAVALVALSMLLEEPVMAIVTTVMVDAAYHRLGHWWIGQGQLLAQMLI